MPELPQGLLEAVEVLIDAGKLRPGSYTIRNAVRERIEHGVGLPLDDGGPAIPAATAFQFEVTSDHLKLFAHASFRGPGFNFKRPYGDMTFYELDMADALGVPIPPKAADGKAGDFTPEQIARFDKLHGEMLFTFQAFLQYAELKPGAFVRRDGRWTRKPAPARP